MTGEIHNLESLLRDRKVAIFLGAGVSEAAGAPSTAELARGLKEHFPDASSNASDLSDICQDIADTPGYGLNALESYVKEKLVPIKPSKWHYMLTEQNWKAIFTTNYDTLIESAFSEKSQRQCVTVDTVEFSNPINDLNKVFVYKLMGSVVDNVPGSSMVLTRSQYHKNLNDRARTFNLLFDLVEAGAMIYVGYSGRDRLLFDIIDKVIDERGIDRLPWGFMLMTHDPAQKEIERLALKRIIPIKMKFEEFMSQLQTLNIKPAEESLSKITQISVPLPTMTYQVSAQEMNEASMYFDVLNPVSFTDETSIEEFFSGTKPSWFGIKKGWAFKREIFGNDSGHSSDVKSFIFPRLQEEWLKREYYHNSVVFLTGPPGSGKTFVAKQLAYEAYKQDVPVLWVDETKAQMDFRYLSEFLRQIDIGGRSTQGLEEQIKALVVLDDFPSISVDPGKLKGYLTSMGRSVVILAVCRENEWEDIREYRESDVFRLDLSLTKEEKPRFIAYMENLGYLEKNSEWESYRGFGIEDSFFAALYTLIDPAKRPLNVIIRDQYTGLSEELQKIYSYIAAIHQFGFLINRELLVRSLKISYDEFFALIDTKPAEGIILDKFLESGTSYYFTHHPIMANKTIQFFYPDPAKQFNLYKKIFDEVSFQDTVERALIERFFPLVFSVKSRLTDLTISQKRELFRLVTGQGVSATLIHHWGILETRDGNYDEAEKLLGRALSVDRPTEGYRGESKQFILNSLGNLYAKKGVEQLKRGDIEGSERSFSKADANFLSSRTGGPPNAYTYHSHANMYVSIAETTEDQNQAFVNFSKALSILEDGLEFLDDDSRYMVDQLKLKIFDDLRDETRVRESMHRISNLLNRGDGYYLYASLLRRRRQYSDALSVISEGLTKYPHDAALLTLKAMMVVTDHSIPRDLLYEPLKQWYLNTREHSPHLLFELSVVSFLNEFYEESKKYFAELNEISIGNQDRTRILFKIENSTGTKRRFKGVITNRTSQSTGDIISTELVNLKTPILFRPYLCTFDAIPGRRVEFSIGFSMTGPIATDVRLD